MIIHVLAGEGIKIYERVYNGTKSGTKSWFDTNPTNEVRNAKNMSVKVFHMLAPNTTDYRRVLRAIWLTCIKVRLPSTRICGLPQ